MFWLPLATLLGCGPGGGEVCSEVRWFGAASTAGALSGLVDQWPERHDHPVRFNFAGTNVLAAQLAAGARADLFLSADQQWMDAVKEQPGIARASERHLVANQLVLVARPELARGVDGLALLTHPDVARVAVADPDAVPAGRYAREWLSQSTFQGHSVWSAVEPKLVPTADVRGALALAESDPHIVAVVYRSDLQASDRVEVRHLAKDGPAIRYPVARMNTACPAADRLLQFATGKRGRAVFMAHGFEPVYP